MKRIQLAIVVMPSSAIATAPLNSQSWHDLYLKALFETNREQMPARIRDAEQALLSREHELFAAPQCLVEREAVNAALHALHLLATCVQPKRKLAA